MEQGRVAQEPVVLTHKNEKWPTRRTAETQINELAASNREHQ